MEGEFFEDRLQDYGRDRDLRAILAPLACYPRGLIARSRAAPGGLRLVKFCPGTWLASLLSCGLVLAPRVARLMAALFAVVTISDHVPRDPQDTHERGVAVQDAGPQSVTAETSSGEYRNARSASPRRKAADQRDQR